MEVLKNKLSLWYHETATMKVRYFAIKVYRYLIISSVTSPHYLLYMHRSCIRTAAKRGYRDFPSESSLPKKHILFYCLKNESDNVGTYLLQSITAKCRYHLLQPEHTVNSTDWNRQVFKLEVKYSIRWDEGNHKGVATSMFPSYIFNFRLRHGNCVSL